MCCGTYNRLGKGMKVPKGSQVQGGGDMRSQNVVPCRATVFLSLLACGWYRLSAYQACHSLEEGAHCVASRLDAETTMDNRFNIHFSVI